MNSYDGGHLKIGFNLIVQRKWENFHGGLMVGIGGFHQVVVPMEDKYRNYEDYPRFLPM